MIPADVGPVVFCDANVLYGNMLRDVLMWLGVRRSLRLRWTEQVEAEWIGNLLEHRPDLLPERLTLTREAMNRALPDALVHAAPDEAAYFLPDPDDRHVLAAALACDAEVLLTFNLKDFPAEAVPAELRVVHPDVFLTEHFARQPQGVLTALQSVRSNLKRPPMSQEEVLEILKKAGLPHFVQAVKASGLTF